MKKNYLYILCLALGLYSCGNDTPLPSDEIIGDDVENPGEKNEEGNESGKDEDKKEDSAHPRGAITSTYCDVWTLAYGDVDNEIWYAKLDDGKVKDCSLWLVTEVNADTATVEVYDNWNFDKSTKHRFYRNASGALCEGKLQYTCMVGREPDFWTGKPKGSFYTCKQTYSNGSYNSTYYTNNNGYTTTTEFTTIDEVWDKWGMKSRSYSYRWNDPGLYGSYGSWSIGHKLVNAKTKANGEFNPSLAKPRCPKIGQLSWVDEKEGEVARLRIETGMQLNESEFAYCICLAYYDENGNYEFLPAYKYSDIDEYYTLTINRSLAGYTELGFKQKAWDMGEASGGLIFSICTLGYGDESEIEPNGFIITFGGGEEAKIRRAPVTRAEVASMSQNRLHLRSNLPGRFSRR